CGGDLHALRGGRGRADGLAAERGRKRVGRLACTVTGGLLEQRKRVLELDADLVREAILVVAPLNPVLRVRDVEALDVQLAHDALRCEAVVRTEDRAMAVGLAHAALDEPPATEDAEA